MSWGIYVLICRRDMMWTNIALSRYVIVHWQIEFITPFEHLSAHKYSIFVLSVGYVTRLEFCTM
jgi:hypothetical protein